MSGPLAPFRRAGRWARRTTASCRTASSGTSSSCCQQAKLVEQDPNIAWFEAATLVPFGAPPLRRLRSQVAAFI